MNIVSDVYSPTTYPAGFKPIVYNGNVYKTYAVNADGIFLSFKRNPAQGKIIKVTIPDKKTGRYPAFGISIDGEKINIPAHRAVAETWIVKKPGDGHIVRHKDNDKTNWKLSNLEYGTHKENM